MKSKWMVMLVVGCCLAAMVVGAGAYEDPAVEYTADQFMSAEGYQTVSKVFHAHQKMRTEMQGVVTISRMDKNVVWVLMPQVSTYQEHSTNDPQTGSPAPDLQGSNVQMTPLGTETINGVATTRNKFVSTDPQGRKIEGTAWLSREGIMVKGVFNDASQTNKPVTIELKNLEMTKQDPGLFEIPAGYTKMPAMGMGLYPPASAGQAAMPPPQGQAQPKSQDAKGKKGVNEGVDSINRLKGLLGK